MGLKISYSAEEVVTALYSICEDAGNKYPGVKTSHEGSVKSSEGAPRLRLRKVQRTSPAGQATSKLGIHSRKRLRLDKR